MADAVAAKAAEPPSSDAGRCHRITVVSIIGGFLDRTTLDLTGGLNCIIGGRGTGKTTVVELVRFALDALPAPQVDGAARRRIETLIQQNLGGGRVEVTIETRDGLTYVVTRAVGEEPIVLDADGKATEITVKAGGLFKAAIYSQNEVESIADNPRSQLHLIDSFDADRIAELSGEVTSVQHALDANAAQITPLQLQIASLTEELGALPGIEAKLKGYANAGGQNAEAINQAHAHKALRDREKRAVDGIRQYLVDYGAQLGRFSRQIATQVNALFGRDVVTGPNAAAVTAIRDALLQCASDVDAAIATARRRIDAGRALLSQGAQALSVAHNQQELAFRTLIEQHQAAQGQAVERSRLERIRNELLAKQGTRDRLTGQLTGLQQQRRELHQRLSDLRDRRFSMRRAVAESITRALRGTVRASVQQAGDTEQYAELLAGALRSARVKAGVVAGKIANAVMPARLAAIVQSGDTQPLVEEADLSEDQARKVLEVLANSDTLCKLETAELTDMPRIELNDGGEYKESGSLSTGQKCTTILPILLLDSDNPLLIDQPEDNLDNRFIFECVVGSIQAMKARRQLVFVTHNPNIPVLGDAERLFVLESDGVNARLANQGTVDECKGDILTLLEGGEEAFRRRQSRYANRDVV